MQPNVSAVQRADDNGEKIRNDARENARQNGTDVNVNPKYKKQNTAICNGKGVKNREYDDDIMIVEQPLSRPIEIDDNTTDVDLESDINSIEGDNAAEPIVQITISEKGNIENFLDCEEPVGGHVLKSSNALEEPLTNDIGESEVLDHDPMDLLELNERSEVDDSIRNEDDGGGDEEEDEDDETDSNGSSNGPTNISEWMEVYTWFLYEEADEYYGYCLYCDTKLNVRSFSSVKQHDLSLYHKERTENYLAFRDEEEKSGLNKPLVEIKQEFGTDSRTRALKLKRKTQVEALNNFNWRRWLNDHKWLHREDNSEGTIGYCKYCRIRLNVEFFYLRERHEMSVKHKEAEKAYKDNENGQGDKKEEKTISRMTRRQSMYRSRIEVMDEYGVEDDEEDGDDDYGKGEGGSNSNKLQSDEFKWRTILGGVPLMCRCIVCDIKMRKTSYTRHASTKAHLLNVQRMDEQNRQRMEMKPSSPVKEEDQQSNSSQNKPNWKLCTKQHPWLKPFPKDESLPYCLYCERRLQYGNSPVKRRIHENSIQHKQAEIEYKQRNKIVDVENDVGVNDKGTPYNDGEEIDAERAIENIEDECEVDVEERPKSSNNIAENETDSKIKRVFRHSPEWVSRYVWCKRYKKDPANYYFCIYCKTLLSINHNRAKHQRSVRHLEAEQEYLRKGCITEQRNVERPDAASYPWLVYFNNVTSMYYCKYCKLRLSNSYKKEKHQRSKNHLSNEQIWKSKAANDCHEGLTSPSEYLDPVNKKRDRELIEQGSAALATASASASASSIISVIKPWRIKYPWLTYRRNETRPHYAYCKICQISIFVRSGKHASKHQRSSRHFRHVALSRRPGQPKLLQEKANATQHMNDTAQSEYFNEMEQLNADERLEKFKKRFSWIEKSTLPNYVYCRLCDAQVLLRYIQIHNHHNSIMHRESTAYPSADTVTASKVDSNETINKEHKTDDETDNVSTIEENNSNKVNSEAVQESGISNQNYQRESTKRPYSNYSSTNNSSLRNENQADTNKRFKRSHGGDTEFYEGRHSVMTDILNTPLTLASCLGPLIQQQIQQTTNNLAQNLPQTKSEKSAQENPIGDQSFDLFFRSISETMKKLPADLAAEGKVKIMQIICELELKAIKRGKGEHERTNGTSNTNTDTSSKSICPISKPGVPSFTKTNPQNDTNTERMTISEVTSLNNASSSKRGTPTVIGVMDKTGLHPIPVKRTMPLEQMAKVAATSDNQMINDNTSAGIRCIPLKSLTNASAGNVQNSALNRNQGLGAKPISQTFTVPANTSAAAVVTAATSTANLLNYRNIQITKKQMPSVSAQCINTQPSQQPITGYTKITPRTYPTNVPNRNMSFNGSFISSPLFSSTPTTQK